MISRGLLRTEIDRVRAEYLDLLYGIIRLPENGSQATDAGTRVDWHGFVASTYGCLSDASISREPFSPPPPS